MPYSQRAFPHFNPQLLLEISAKAGPDKSWQDTRFDLPIYGVHKRHTFQFESSRQFKQRRAAHNPLILNKIASLKLEFHSVIGLALILHILRAGFARLAPGQRTQAKLIGGYSEE
jgi:hypothetical protein